MLYEFKGHRPIVDPSAFVHPQATVTGDVSIGKNVYIGPGAAIRGDWGRIIIEDGCNVQESCTIHMFPGVTVRLKEGAHIGHGAIVHGAIIGRNCLIGMNSVIMDNVDIGDECIIGALTFIKAGEKIPRRSVVVIIEVLSPTTKDYDRTTKFRLYRDIPTFQEYILIDSQSVLVEHHYKNAEGGWICRTWDKFTDILEIKTAGVDILMSEIYKNTGQ